MLQLATRQFYLLDAGQASIAHALVFRHQALLLIISDLEETLIHASATKIRADFDFQVFPYFVYKRLASGLFGYLCVPQAGCMIPKPQPGYSEANRKQLPD